MRHVFELDKLNDLEIFSPSNHSGTVNRKLVDRETGSVYMSIWEGTIDPGCGAKGHCHDAMEQAFVILEGEALFRMGEEEYLLKKGSLVFVPTHVEHKITSCGDLPLRTLVINAPAPQTMDIWGKSEKKH